MFRAVDNLMFMTNDEWASYNPVVPFETIAISKDTGGMKIGNGLDIWTSLSFTSGSSIGYKSVEVATVYNDNIVRFNATSDKWEYVTHGKQIRHSEISSDTATYDKFAVIVETHDVTDIPTGRFKVSDGITRLDQLPWFGGIHVCNEFATGITGKSIVWSGYEWVNKKVYSEDDFEFPTIPTEVNFLRDDGTFATIPTLYTPTSSTINDIVVFSGTDGVHVADSGVSISSIVTNDGTQSATFQINIGSGPKLKNTGGELSVYKNDGTTLNTITAAEFHGTSGLYSMITVGYPTESTSVNITSDGTYLYADGGKLIDTNHDGHGSGLDADLLDGKHASQFVTADSVFNMLTYKGGIDCSGNPNFPSATVKDWYKVTISGRIGGASGTIVATGDNIICKTTTASGDFASVGSNWDVYANYNSDVITGSGSSTDNEIVIFDGTSGNQVKNSNKTLAEIDDDALVYAIVMGG